MSRRDFVRCALAAAMFPWKEQDAMADGIVTKPIPKTGERLPVIGLGTWQTFDVGGAESVRAPLREVLREFVRAGGTVIDSSPMYGKSESVTGELAAELGVREGTVKSTLHDARRSLRSHLEVLEDG